MIYQYGPPYLMCEPSRATRQEKGVPYVSPICSHAGQGPVQGPREPLVAPAPRSQGGAATASACGTWHLFYLLVYVFAVPAFH